MQSIVFAPFFSSASGGRLPFSQQLTFTAAEAYAMHDSITKSRWDWGGSISDYSFRHMSEFFPVGIISKPAKALPLHSKIDNSIGNMPVKGDTSLTAYLKLMHVSGIIILHKDTILFEKYPGMQPDELHTLQSVTKVITSALIARLEIEKRIDPAKPVETYLPELKGTAWEGISVANILNMKSGIEAAESVGAHPFTDPKHPYYSFESSLGLLPRVESTPADVYKYIASLKRSWTPGEKTEYNSINTFVLGWLAEKVTGKKYADLVTEWLWEPMGASSNAYVCLSPKGIPWTHGGVSSTLADLARFGILFTKTDRMRRKGGIISDNQINKISASGELGYQWDRAKAGEGMLKTGFGDQGLFVNPEKNIVIAYFNFIGPDWGFTDMLPVIRQLQAGVLKRHGF